MEEAGASATSLSADEKNWGLACHLSALIGIVIPLANVLAPLVIWLMKRESMPFVDDQGRESLNFQISITIYGLVATVLMLVFVGFLLLAAIGLFAMIMVIIAAIRSSEGKRYRYPLNLRLVK